MRYLQLPAKLVKNFEVTLQLTIQSLLFGISQKFGENATNLYAQMGLKGHNGLDILSPEGGEIYAAHDGLIHKVIEETVGTSGTRGKGILLRQRDADSQGRYLVTAYWHLLDFSLPEKPEGLEVKAGQLLGHSNNTGYSTGPHLHFGVKYYDLNLTTINENNGYGGYVDPMPYLNPMEYIINAAKDQFLLFPAIKVALSIGDNTELSALQKNGVAGNPVTQEVPTDYLVYPATQLSRIAPIVKQFMDLLNIK